MGLCRRQGKKAKKPKNGTRPQKWLIVFDMLQCKFCREFQARSADEVETSFARALVRPDLDLPVGAAESGQPPRSSPFNALNMTQLDYGDHLCLTRSSHVILSYNTFIFGTFVFSFRLTPVVL